MTSKGRSTWAGIVMAFGVIALTRPAPAQEDAPRDTAPAATPAPAAAETPLALRPTRPLEMAQEPSHTSTGWKILVLATVLGGAALYLRKRAAPKRPADARLTIVRRASVGIRSELLVVDVEGQRLLLGVTPHSIQSLATLDTDDAPRASTETAARDAGHIGQRFAAMLSTVEGSSRDADGATPTGGGPAQDPTDDAFGGQARGLVALRRRG